MRNNASSGYGDHVGIVEVALSAEGREISYGSEEIAVGIDIAFVNLYVFPYSNAVLMRPSFVGF
jgi:hypothetical protein